MVLRVFPAASQHQYRCSSVFCPLYRMSAISAAPKEIEDNRGLLYDPDVVDACVAVFREEDYELPSDR